eukprot:Skav225493  [mRNA]  locus=scaffold1821:18109:18396:- [translate_table: standard]
MIVEFLVNSVDNLSEFRHHLLNSRLTICIMILNIAEEFGQTPVCPCFNCLKSIISGRIHIDLLRYTIKFGCQQDNDERRCKIVDSLNIAARWVAH